MMPEDSVYGVWPRSGEIDIAESRGNAAGYLDGGRDTYTSTLHWGKHTKLVQCHQKLIKVQVPRARTMVSGGRRMAKRSDDQISAKAIIHLALNGPRTTCSRT